MLRVETAAWDKIDEMQLQMIDMQLRTCWGFKKPVSGEQLKAAVEQIRAKKKEADYANLSYALIVYPNIHNPDAVERDRKVNVDLITELKKEDAFFFIDEWRVKHADARAEAKKKWDDFYKTPHRQSIIMEKLLIDISRFVGTGHSVSEKEAIDYVIDEVIDCLTLIEIADKENKDKSLSRATVLYYNEKFYQTISYAVQCAEHMGYKESSLWLISYAVKNEISLKNRPEKKKWNKSNKSPAILPETNAPKQLNQEQVELERKRLELERKEQELELERQRLKLERKEQELELERQRFEIQNQRHKLECEQLTLQLARERLARENERNQFYALVVLFIMYGCKSQDMTFNKTLDKTEMHKWKCSVEAMIKQWKKGTPWSNSLLIQQPAQVDGPDMKSLSLKL